MNPREKEHPTSNQIRLSPESTAFHTAMAHLYRGEMHRMTVWRQRLDVTTNWAFLLTMGLTTFTLGSSQVPHYTLLLGLAAIAISILIEARRYRHLHHSQWRLYVMERGYFAPLLKAISLPCEEKWREMMAQDLDQRRFRVGLLIAIRLRLRRNYLLLVYFITAVWITKLFVHPMASRDPREFYARFAIGEVIPSWFVVVTAAAFIGTATILAISCPSAEVVEASLTSDCDELDTQVEARERGELHGKGAN
jgi:uncharacterized membrane protein